MQSRRACANRALSEPVHRWHKFVFSFEPSFVREQLEQFGADKTDCVLDPFCGAGTTLVECKRLGIPSLGLDSNPVSCFVSRVKVDWDIEPDALLAYGQRIRKRAERELAQTPRGDKSFRGLAIHEGELLIKQTISPAPLHKTLVLREQIDSEGGRFREQARLALVNCAVEVASNLRFAPEVSASRIKNDADVIGAWAERIAEMALDLSEVRARRDVQAAVYNTDAREVVALPRQASLVITSPPYPNEKDYTRATRLEAVLLGYLTNRSALRALKQTLLCSNSRGLCGRDELIGMRFERVRRLAEEIEERRIALGKTSGFERMYKRVILSYFGGMARHFESLKSVLRSLARLAYVVGDQQSFFRVPVHTGEILGEIADLLGYQVEGRRVLRRRFASKTGVYLQEEVLLLKLKRKE